MESIYDSLVDAALAMYIGEWLEIISDEYTSPEHARLCNPNTVLATDKEIV